MGKVKVTLFFGANHLTFTTTKDEVTNMKLDIALAISGGQSLNLGIGPTGEVLFLTPDILRNIAIHTKPE